MRSVQVELTTDEVSLLIKALHIQREALMAVIGGTSVETNRELGRVLDQNKAIGTRLYRA